MYRLQNLLNINTASIQPFVNELIASLPTISFNILDGITFMNNPFVDPQSNYIPDDRFGIRQRKRFAVSELMQFTAPYWLYGRDREPIHSPFLISIDVAPHLPFEELDSELRYLVQTQDLSHQNIRHLLDMSWSIHDHTDTTVV